MSGKARLIGGTSAERHPEGTDVIICHCKVVSDRDVTAALDSGARTIAQVCRATGAGSGCGSCVFTLKRLTCDHEAAQVSSQEVESAAS